MLSGKLTLLSLCSLGSIGFIPFFLSDDSGQSSKSVKKWAIKNGNYEVASVHFSPTSSSGQNQNQHLKGIWSFLNQKKSNEATLFSSAGFDIAIPTENLADSKAKPVISDKKVRIIYCNRDKDGEMVTAKTVSTNTEIQCKDLSDSWYLGLIKGKYYRAIFAVIKKGILKTDSGTSIDSLTKLTQADAGNFHEKLTENLKLATGPKKGLDTEAILINVGSSTYGGKDYSRKWCSEDRCLIWGTITSMGEENKDANNCEPKNSFTDCNIEIIDISKDTTLTSLSSFWTLGEQVATPSVF